MPFLKMQSLFLLYQPWNKPRVHINKSYLYKEVSFANLHAILKITLYKPRSPPLLTTAHGLFNVKALGKVQLSTEFPSTTQIGCTFSSLFPLAALKLRKKTGCKMRRGALMMKGGGGGETLCTQGEEESLLLIEGSSVVGLHTPLFPVQDCTK